MTFLLIAVSRTGYRLLMERSPFSRRLIVVGAGRAGQAIAHTIERYVHGRYDVVGFVDEELTKELPAGAPKILGAPADLLDLAKKYRAEEVVLAITYRLHDSTFRAILDCQECGLQVTPMPVLYEELTGRVPVEHVGDNWYVALPLRHASSGGLFPIAKRAFDLVVALVGLALLAVLILPLGIAIRLSSPCPIFFSQDRVGRGGRVFRMHKLRSMIAGVESDVPVWAADNDPRVTWVGRWMRRTHLDELPQMWSILRGEMSVVGPRPEQPQFVLALEQDSLLPAAPRRQAGHHRLGPDQLRVRRQRQFRAPAAGIRPLLHQASIRLARPADRGAHARARHAVPGMLGRRNPWR